MRLLTLLALLTVACGDGAASSTPDAGSRPRSDAAPSGPRELELWVHGDGNVGFAVQLGGEPRADVESHPGVITTRKWRLLEGTRVVVTAFMPWRGRRFVGFGGTCMSTDSYPCRHAALGQDFEAWCCALTMDRDHVVVVDAIHPDEWDRGLRDRDGGADGPPPPADAARRD